MTTSLPLPANSGALQFSPVKAATVVSPAAAPLLSLPGVGAAPPDSSALPALPMPSLPSILSPASAQLATDTARASQLAAAGSGISQIKNPVLRGLANAADIAGSVFRPIHNLEYALPGTNEHHQLLLNQQTALIDQDQKNQAAETAQQVGQAQVRQRDADTAQTTAETIALPQKEADQHALTQAQIDNQQSETTERNTPKAPSLANAYAAAVDAAIKAGRDPQTDPVVQHIQDAITAIMPGQNKGVEAPKTIPIQVNGRPHQMAWDAKTNRYDLDQGESGEKPTEVKVTTGAQNDAALDREIKQYGAPHQKTLDTADAQLEKIDEARGAINGNAESQAIGIPKVLTALVSGQGTGVRITQAELAGIAHARGISGDVEGYFNKLSGQGSLSKQQQVQISHILDDVKARIIQKRAIAAGAVDAMNGATTRAQILAADAAARKQLSDYETGGVGGSSQQGSPSPQTHTFNLSAWHRANPGGDVNAARTAAQKAGYQVVQ